MDTNNTTSTKRRPTIGLLAQNGYNPLWLGVSDSAQKHDVNSVFFCGGEILSPNVKLAQSNVLFELADSRILDGLVTNAGYGAAITMYVDEEETDRLIGRFKSIPIVNYEGKLPGIPTVFTDSYQGSREVIQHIIEVHNYRRILYVRGPTGHYETEERLRAYTDLLAEHGIAYDPNLVCPPGGFDDIDGQADIQFMLDERGLLPGRDFDAIACSEPALSIGVLQKLNERGLRVPGDIPLVSFDDHPLIQCSTPSLTTTRKPFYEVGYRTVEMLLAKMAGQELPERTTLPVGLVVRQSCGCIDPAVIQASIQPDAAAQKDIAAQEDGVVWLQASLRENGLHLDDETIANLLASFMAEFSADGRGKFIRTLDEAISQTAGTNSDLASWQNVLSDLRRHTMASIDSHVGPQAESLWNQARVIIGERAKRAVAFQSFQSTQRAEILSSIGTSLPTATSLDMLYDILAEGLPRLGIRSCYLAMCDSIPTYRYPQPAPEYYNLVMAYDETGRLPIQPGKQRFASYQLAPEGFLFGGRPSNLIALAFSYQQQHFGFGLFDVGARDRIVYEALREYISNALYGIHLLQNVEKRAVQLQTAAAVSGVASSIIDPSQLIQQTVDLVRERFNLYYVGLFLLDEERRYAVLRAGTGEAGQRQLANQHRLTLDENSMIGWCVTHRQARIALDVGKEAVRFNNPNLPLTRSEVALPLISRGQVIGAMSVQSDRETAFAQEDVTVLQTMADQLANAIANSQLFEQTQQRSIELAAAKEAADAAKDEAERARKKAEIEQEKAEAAKCEAEDEQKKAEAANLSLAAQMWQTTGQALLNEKMRGEQDIPALANNVIRQLCKYLNTQRGMLYVIDGELLKLAGSYAYRNKTQVEQFQLGESLIGQAAIEREIITVEMPDDYTVPPSSLGEVTPRYFVGAPFVYDDQTIGVVEIGSLVPLNTPQMEFLNKALENIAIAFTTAQARARVNELYAQTRQQAEELQTQEEELRATNEELEAQTESLRTSETRLKSNQAALESANADLEEKAQALQLQQDKVDQQNRELERKAEELSLASKYKSEFLANMSHELRTPLNSMLILAGMLAKNEEGNLTPDQAESAQVIHAGGTDLLNLINEILDLAKVEAGKMEFRFAPMSWDSLTARMQAQFGPLSQRKELQFITSVADDLPPQIVTDEQRLAQIVKNLLSNAFKFTEQGSISLTIQRAAPASGFAPDQFAAIHVTDTGIGMSPDQQKIVFEAFQQADGSTSRQYGGTGLGLTITREMTRRLGGQVILTSQPGQGSTFTIYLPLQKSVTDDLEQVIHPKPSSARERSPQSAISMPPSSIPDDRDNLQPSDRILLIVEDDPKFAKIVLDYAHKKGFKCLAAADGESALNLCKAHCPAAIVLDLKLPGMSGWDILASIKDDPDMRHIPVHIMSVDDEDLSAYQHGAMGFLTKPVSQQDLDGAFTNIESFISNKIRSLLLVEDDDTLRLSVRKLLEGSDITISEAATGQAALKQLAAQHFDCMILDLSLPDMSGFELLSRLDSDEASPKCPVIVYTGKELTEDENRELLKYADSVIVKGVKSPERLLDETALFLHRVVADMPADKQQTIRKLHSQEAVLSGRQILIVDDDARNAFALSKLLADKGVKMHIAPNASKALEMLERIEISLILTDIMMPGMDGFEFIKALRSQPHFQKLPIIALTAKAMKGDREKCLDAGANDYLSKPIDTDRLFSMLRVWLSRE